MLDVSSLLRLCANKPAPTRSTRESAACTTTRPRCKRDAPEATFREPERSASAGCAWAAIQAGATPNRMPVRSERAKAKPITRGEGAALMGMFCAPGKDRKSTRLNSSHLVISYAVFCLKKKKANARPDTDTR